MIFSISLRPSPVVLLAMALILGGGYATLRDSSGRSQSGLRCDPSIETCEGSSIPSAPVDALPPPLAAADFCRNVGYLCAGLATQDEVRLQRWVGFEGTLVVHVPLPDLSDGTAARDMQRAAAQGIRAWNNQPFPILADLQGDRNPHFAIQWTSSLGGSQLGVARTHWSPAAGLRVVAVELVTQNPFGRGGTVPPRQVRLSAAHEMGHALGLGHSDSERDVMFPTNLATSVSAQDRRSMEVLYETADGTTIRR